MPTDFLLYSGAALLLVWGIAHLFPTRAVVPGVGAIFLGNRLIITMEWIIEGVALIFLGLLIFSVTLIDPGNAVSLAVYLLCCGVLLALAIVSVFAGFRVRFFPFKVCPFLFATAAIFILFGALP